MHAWRTPRAFISPYLERRCTRVSREHFLLAEPKRRQRSYVARNTKIFFFLISFVRLQGSSPNEKCCCVPRGQPLEVVQAVLKNSRDEKITSIDLGSSPGRQSELRAEVVELLVLDDLLGFLLRVDVAELPDHVVLVDVDRRKHG